MKFFLISSNNDTAIGMRLAGIEGVIVHEEKAVVSALEKAIADSEVGIILITEKLASTCREQVQELKQNVSRPLIVEIPDRHSESSVSDALTRYVREAVGIKI